jgi:hypothetical protein
MKLFALLPAGRRCRVEEAALAMLAGPGRIAGLDTQARERARRPALVSLATRHQARTGHYQRQAA